jgi:hypothetical protein
MLDNNNLRTENHNHGVPADTLDPENNSSKSSSGNPTCIKNQKNKFTILRKEITELIYSTTSST